MTKKINHKKENWKQIGLKVNVERVMTKLINQREYRQIMMMIVFWKQKMRLKFLMTYNLILMVYYISLHYMFKILIN